MDELKTEKILAVGISKISAEALRKTIVEYDDENESVAYFKGFTEGINKTLDMITELSESLKSIDMYKLNMEYITELLKLKIIVITEEALAKTIVEYDDKNESFAYMKGFTDAFPKTLNMIKESSENLESLYVVKTETGEFN